MNNARRNFNLSVGALGLAVALGSLPAHAADDAADAQAVVREAQATLNAFRHSKNFPGLGADIQKAKGVLIFPKVLKAGFILGGSGGTGVLMVRDEKSGRWIGPGFYTVASAGFGFQAGVSSAQTLILVNTQKGLDSLYKSKVQVGADTSAAIWKSGVGAGAAVGIDFLSTSMVKGAFVGVSLDGSVIDVRESLNTAFYGKPVTPSEIFVTRGVKGQSASGLQSSLKGLK